jgi:hypothetical protein
MDGKEPIQQRMAARMKNKVDQFKSLIFRRTSDSRESESSLDIEMFNILWAVDGSRTVANMALEGRYDPKYLYSRLIELYQMKLIEIVKTTQSTNPQPTTKKDTNVKKDLSDKKETPKIEEDVVGYVRTMLSKDGFNWK